MKKQVEYSMPAYLANSPGKRQASSESGSPARRKRAMPKSLTVSQMIKLGKLIKPAGEAVVINIYSFEFATLSWSMIPNKVEFTMENVLGQGGFRKAFKARSTSSGFLGQTWVIKRFLEKVNPYVFYCLSCVYSHQVFSFKFGNMVKIN